MGRLALGIVQTRLYDDAGRGGWGEGGRATPRTGSSSSPLGAVTCREPRTHPPSKALQLVRVCSAPPISKRGHPLSREPPAAFAVRLFQGRLHVPPLCS